MTTFSCHRVLGLDISSDFTFRAALPSAQSGDLQFLGGLDFKEPGMSGFSLAYKSRLTDTEGRSVFELWRRGSSEVLRFVDRADFLLEPGTIRYAASGEHARYDTENLFLSAVLAYVLELQGTIALHASAVEINGGAVAFVAASGGGKSSLAAALVQAGHRLITDDVLALDRAVDSVRIRPSYPQIKLNQDVGELLLGETFQSLGRFDPRGAKRCWSPVSAGFEFCTHAAPLDAVYVLSRGRSMSDLPIIREMSRRDGLVELLRSGFTPSLVEGVGLAEARLDHLSQVVHFVPVRALQIPQDFGRLGQTVDSVVRDVLEL